VTGSNHRLIARYAVLLLIAASAACARDDEYDIDEGNPLDSKAAPAPPDNVQLLIPPPFECRAVARDDGTDTDQFPVPKPPFSANVFPCTRCHDKPEDSNPTPRTLTAMHTNIQLVHGPREQWCYDCHNPTFRDKLRLAGGRLISFDTSYELCGQCHGEKLRDWRRGIHGRRTGCWNGKKQYLLCVNCHNPHSPRFKPLHPKPPPVRPSQIQLEGSEP
jgi:hypothetical protein